jgi:hypothetical protein
MDADLYDHLSTTVTNDPHQDQRDEASEAGNTTKRDPGGNGETAPASASPRRQRTMSSSLPEEIDQVVHAISSSPWAARLGTLMGSVKKQVYSFHVCRD